MLDRNYQAPGKNPRHPQEISFSYNKQNSHGFNQEFQCNEQAPLKKIISKRKKERNPLTSPGKIVSGPLRIPLISNPNRAATEKERKEKEGRSLTT